MVTDAGVTPEPSGSSRSSHQLPLISATPFFLAQHLHLPRGPGAPVRLSGPHPGGSSCCRNRSSVHIYARLRRNIGDPIRLRTWKLLPDPEQKPTSCVGRWTRLCPGYLLRPSGCSSPPTAARTFCTTYLQAGLDVSKRRTFFSLFIISSHQKHILLCSSTPVNTWCSHMIT